MKLKVNGIYDLKIINGYGSSCVEDAFKKGTLRVKVKEIRDHGDSEGAAIVEILLCEGALNDFYWRDPSDPHLDLFIEAFNWAPQAIELENK